MSGAQIPDHVFAKTVLDLLGPVRHHLEDPTCSEIMINGPSTIFIERAGKIVASDARFASAQSLEAAIRNIAQYVGKSVSPDRPILEARLPDGSRVEAIFPPASRQGVCVAIRRFPKDVLTIEKLLELGALTEAARDLLALAVLLKQNIIVGGGTGSGKTSMLNALGSFIPADERVVVIEDSSEVQLQQPHVVYLEARPPGPNGQGEVTVRSLLRATLRLRPDRMVVGEVRAGEALDLVQAMTSGHGGCLATAHATYPSDTLHRLETMALMSDIDLPLEALRSQIASAVNVLVQVSRLGDGSRRITHIAECTGYTRDDGYQVTELLIFQHRGRDAKSGGVRGGLVPTGRPSKLAQTIVARGYELPTGLVAAESTEAHP